MGEVLRLDDFRKTPAAPAAESAPPARVLVADPEPETAAVVVDMLRVLGFAAVWRDSADAALSFCRDAAPDAVLCEMGMLTSDRRHLLEALRCDCPDVPVAVLTGWLDHPDCRNRVLAGVAMVIAKPVGLDNLGVLVAGLTSGVSLRLRQLPG